MRLRLLPLGLAAVAIAAAALVGIQIVLERPFSARDEPTFVDAFVARWWRRLAVPRDEAGRRNPVPAAPEAVARGREHFAADCAACHGSDGRGGTLLGRGLYPKPPDLTAPATQSLADGELFWVIQNGVRLSGMPAWGYEGEEGDQATWEIVHFIRRLPRLSPQEVGQMAAMRPRSPLEFEDEEAARRFLGEPAAVRQPSGDAHQKVLLLGTVSALDSVRLRIRTAPGASVSLLLDHPASTRFVRGDQLALRTEVRNGGRVAVLAVRHQDWWLAREVRLPSGSP